MRVALEDLGLERIDVIHAGTPRIHWPTAFVGCPW